MYKSELYLIVDLDPALYCRKDRVSLHYSKKQESAIKSDACTLQLFFFKIKHKYFIGNPMGWKFISEQYEYLIFFYFWNEQELICLKIYYENECKSIGKKLCLRSTKESRSLEALNAGSPSSLERFTFVLFGNAYWRHLSFFFVLFSRRCSPFIF